MKQATTYTVRGFNFIRESFDQPTGAMSEKDTFSELVVDSQAEAVTALLIDEEFASMSVPFVLDLVGINTSASKAEVLQSKNVLQVVDLTIKLVDCTDKQEVRALKTSLREVLKRWAEKSRVKGHRGWRSSAIKTPKFVYQALDTLVKVQVILSNAIIYGDVTCDLEPPTRQFVETDLRSLLKQLRRELDLDVELLVQHSIFGTWFILR